MNTGVLVTVSLFSSFVAADGVKSFLECSRKWHLKSFNKQSCAYLLYLRNVYHLIKLFLYKSRVLCAFSNFLRHSETKLLVHIIALWLVFLIKRFVFPFHRCVLLDLLSPHRPVTSSVVLTLRPASLCILKHIKR